MKKIGIFGGVFNPPHNFHFTIAQSILNENKDFVKIIFVPTGNKYDKPEVIDAEHRFNMLKLICDKNEHFAVSRFEIDSKEQPYSYETLDHFKSIYPDSELYFIFGTDNLKTFSKWKNPEYLLKNYSLFVYERGTDKIDEIIEHDEFLQKYKENIKKANCDIFTNLNSSFIRKKMLEGKNVSYLIPDSVYEYIKKNKLYEQPENLYFA
ncbi:MAG: nicotinate (nicotinamide) nucleotide adenylyltransferase [Clostridia bacterium]|nr:nicotinate (nicotinamide) nucleotide adenylyltransferase [Clostridia bacterium]